MEAVLDPDFLAQYERESEWAEAVARYRDRGLPFLFFGGCVWIPRLEAHEWIASRVKRRNQRR
jgi:hypothetical protein